MKNIMIIVWKWQYLKDFQITTEWINKQNLSNDFVQWKGKYFLEYRVASPNQSRDYIYYNDRVIMSRVERGAAKDAMPFIKQLINLYDNDDNRIFVFLHRNDGFTSKDVVDILLGNKADKCFLFGDGQDFIYYSTQDIGLLGDDGKYKYEPIRGKDIEIRVAEEDKKIVYKSPFDKVWLYYENEIYTKTLELKNDLLGYLYPSLFSTGPKIIQERIYQLLEDNEELLLRVKSFVNTLSESEKEKMKAIEIKMEKSLLFDDSKMNLSQESDTKEMFNKTRFFIESLLVKDGTKKLDLRTLLHDLQESFNELLNLISVNYKLK